MADDYEQAAVRHFVDADSLAAIGRFDNAGHLVGFSAECALKKQIRTLHRDSTRRVDGHYREPLRELRLLLNQRRMTGRLLAFCQRSDYLSGWSVDQRYSSDGTVNEVQFLAWRTQAALALQLSGIRSINRPENAASELDNA